MYGSSRARGREPPRSSRGGNVSWKTSAPVAAAIRAAARQPALPRRRPAQQQRRAAGAQRARGSLHGLGRRRRHGQEVPRRRRPEALVPAGVRGQDQRRHAAAPGRRDRLGGQGRGRAGVARRPDPVRSGRHDRLDVARQRRAERLVRHSVLADEVHHRRAALVGVVHVRERVAEARPEVQQRRRRDLRHARVAVRGRRGDALEQRQHAAHRRHAVHRRHQVHLRRARVREADLHAARGQRPQDALGAVQSASSNAAYASSPNSQKRASSTDGCASSASRTARSDDCRGLAQRVAVDAGRDRGERDPRVTGLVGELDRAPVAGRQQLRLARRAAAPHRPDRVDHVPHRQVAGAGELRVAGLAAAEPRHSSSSAGPGGAVDRPVHATAAQQRRVRGVDDRVRLRVLRDVSAMQRYPSHAARYVRTRNSSTAATSERLRQRRIVRELLQPRRDAVQMRQHVVRAAPRPRAPVAARCARARAPAA